MPYYILHGVHAHTHRDIALPTGTLNIGKHVWASFCSGQVVEASLEIQLRR